MTAKSPKTTKAANESAAAPAAGSLPLFYKSPMPLDAERHKTLALSDKIDFSYARIANAVPVNMIEMPQVCHFYPIAFSPDGKATPVALMGLRDSENLFVNDKGEWASDIYIPAYVRRYPFIFSEMPGSEQLTLCVDNTPDTVSEKGNQKFFGPDGKPSPLANNALEFCKSYHAAAQQTQAFSEALAKSGVLVDRQAEITVGNDKKIQFTGFQIVDEKKLNELPEKTFLEWRTKGWLPFIYAHLFSGVQWQRLTRMLNERMESGK